jgi:hypothetical protein
MSGQLHDPATLPPGERTLGIDWIKVWVGPTTGLNDVEKRKMLPLLGLELRILDRPARSQSLYKLSYPYPKFWFKDKPNWLSYYVGTSGV